MVDFVDLTPIEKENVLIYRNHKNIRKWMYNTDEINLNEHIPFINSLIGNSKNHYLLIKKDGIDIGVIDFVFKDKEAFFGLYANPFEKVVGVGRILEEVCIKYVFDILKLDKLKLEVFSENKQVINLHKKFKFQETNKKVVNGKDVTCMELKK